MKTKFKIIIVIGICVLVAIGIIFTVKGIKTYKGKKEQERLVLEYRNNKKNQYLEENEKYTKGTNSGLEDTIEQVSNLKDRWKFPDQDSKTKNF